VLESAAAAAAKACLPVAMTAADGLGLDGVDASVYALCSRSMLTGSDSQLMHVTIIVQPTQALHCISPVFSYAANHFLLPGKYVLLYNGDGKVTLEGDATVTAESPGRLDLSIKPAAGARRKRQTCATCGTQSGEDSLLLASFDSVYAFALACHMCIA
jgi:hypothetical protein